MVLNTNPPFLFIDGYVHFLNYHYLHRVYPLHRVRSGPSPRFSIRRPHAPHEIALPWRTLRCDATCRHRFPLEPPPPNFEVQTQQNPPSIALCGFEAQTIKKTTSIAPHLRTPCPGHVSRQSSTAPATRFSLPRPRVSACPRCQPPRLVTRLLWSINQDSTLVLHRSRSISASLHDLHLSRRLPSMCFTTAHHKPTDMVTHS
jgi:hypothetical protein